MTNDPRHEHRLKLEYMADDERSTPIALKARCIWCNHEWQFDASVKEDLMPLETQLAAARADAEALATLVFTARTFLGNSPQDNQAALDWQWITEATAALAKHENLKAGEGKMT